MKQNFVKIWKKMPSSGAVYGIVLFVIIFSAAIPGYLSLYNVQDSQRFFVLFPCAPVWRY